MNDFLEQLLRQLRAAFDPSMIGSHLGQDLPGAPDFGQQIESMGSISDQLAGLFGPEQRAEVISGYREAGAQDIGQAGAGARRAIGSQAGATGMTGSAPFTSQITDTFGQEAQAMTGLERGAVDIGLDFDQNFMQALLAQLGAQGQIANLKNIDFQNLFGLGQARGQGMGNFMDMWGNLAAVEQLGGF